MMTKIGFTAFFLFSLNANAAFVNKSLDANVSEYTSTSSGSSESIRHGRSNVILEANARDNGTEVSYSDIRVNFNGERFPIATYSSSSGSQYDIYCFLLDASKPHAKAARDSGLRVLPILMGSKSATLNESSREGARFNLTLGRHQGYNRLSLRTLTCSKNQRDRHNF